MPVPSHLVLLACWSFPSPRRDRGGYGLRLPLFDQRAIPDRMSRGEPKHKIDCIVVSNLDRFGRSVLHLTQQLATLKTQGVRFVAVSQGLDTDENNPTASL